MIARTWIVAVTLLVAGAGSVFQLKYAVVDLEHRRDSLEAEIRATDAEITKQHANYAVLTEPDRLARLAGRLELVPGGASRLADVAELGMRNQLVIGQRSLDAQLPSGQLVTLKLKPVSPSPAELSVAQR